MRISARCDYACRALLELALHWPQKKPLTRHDISSKQDISREYLVQILIQLRRMGLVQSIRGKQGGYLLAKAPSQIRLSQVMREIGGPLLPMANPLKKEKSVFVDIWQEVEGAMAKILDKVSFEDIANKAKGSQEALIYTI